ncbi:MAG: nucleoside transporter C-terminal domain-containing protein, partial [Acidobacteriota bacterium]
YLAERSADPATETAGAARQRLLRAAAVAAVLAVALAVLVPLAHAIGGGWVIAAAALTAAVAGWRGHERVQRAGAAATIAGLLALIWAENRDGRAIFRGLSDGVAAFLDLSLDGAAFMFGNLAQSEHFFVGEGAGWPGFGFQFAFSVLPTIIFFSAFMSVLYHLGIVQVVIAAMARFMRWSMQTSGSETMSCSANVFVGQTEAPFLIKPFLDEMTPSELHAVMVGGFATIAGGVLAGYIQMGVDPGHLIAASVMSAPAALVIAKLLYPETEASATAGDHEIIVPREARHDNLVEAAAEGITDGLKLALNVAAMLIGFIALIAVVDAGLGLIDGWIDGGLLGRPLVGDGSGEYAGFVPGSLRTVFGILLAPLAWVMGVPWADARAVGNLLGIKLAVNEFVAFGQLGIDIQEGRLSERAATIATYALCGFANFSSIGIQIGGIGALAPERRQLLAKIGVRAMCGGALASWMTATVAGMLL